MYLHFETYLYRQANNDMYMWNQVNCTKNHYANIGMKSPYNQWSYPKVSYPHQWIPSLVWKVQMSETEKILMGGKLLQVLVYGEFIYGSYTSA